MELIYILLGLFILGIILRAIVELFGGIAEGLEEFLPELWRKSNSFGRILFFGLPVLALTYFVFSFIFYTVIPYIIANDLIGIFLIILCIGTYFSCAIIGWDGGNIDYKNDGIISLIARIIFLLPAMPVIYPLFYLKQIFCKAIFSNFKATWNPHYITEEHSWYEEDIVKTDEQVYNIVENFTSFFESEINDMKECCKLKKEI